MAPEQKFELIDKYLRGELTAEESAVFEQQLQTDPGFQKEVNFQKEVIEGIRRARIAQLKAMLNNVPVPPANPLSSGAVAKIIGSVVIVGSISTALYFYFNSDTTEQPFLPSEESVLLEEMPEAEPDNKPDDSDSSTAGKPEEGKDKQNEPKARLPKSEPGVAVKPQLEVYTPSDEELREQIEKEHRQVKVIEKGFVTSSIEVETNKESRKHNFHYAFRNNKLVLYGNFEENLYEILEFISEDDRTVVLYYKSTYYLLDTDKEDPTPLVAIRDRALLDKLKKFRKK